MKPNEKAKAWRERIGLSVPELADLTGYSVPAIYQFESGINGAGQKTNEWALQRYQMVCAAVDYQKRTGRVFEW